MPPRPSTLRYGIRIADMQNYFAFAIIMPVFQILADIACFNSQECVTTLGCPRVLDDP